MNYLYFDISFFWGCICICATFLFCSRVLFIQKTEKIDPVNVVKSPKKITAAKKIKQDELMNKLLENG